MKEHKFRGKRIDNGEWVFGFLFKLGRECGFEWCIGVEPLYSNDYSEIYKDCYYEVDPTTVGRFTGIYDKNNVEVYEDDIVLHEVFKKKTVVWGNTIIECLAGDCGFMYDGTLAFLHSKDSLFIKVIGNIHE